MQLSLVGFPVQFCRILAFLLCKPARPMNGGYPCLFAIIKTKYIVCPADLTDFFLAHPFASVPAKIFLLRRQPGQPGQVARPPISLARPPVRSRPQNRTDRRAGEGNGRASELASRGERDTTSYYQSSRSCENESFLVRNLPFPLLRPR